MSGGLLRYLLPHSTPFVVALILVNVLLTALTLGRSLKSLRAGSLLPENALVTGHINRSAVTPCTLHIIHSPPFCCR